MDKDEFQSMKVKKSTLEKARVIQCDKRLADWQVLEVLFAFYTDHKKEFDKWKKKVPELIKK